MVALVSEYVTLEQRSPGDFWGRCPFHEERSPSFHVLAGKGLFKCFGCGKGGDVFRFVEEIEGVGFGDALRRLAERAGVVLSERSPAERARDERRVALRRASELAAEFFQEVLWSETPAGAKGRAALRERGVREETARAFGLGLAPDDWGALRGFGARRGIDPEVLVELGLLGRSRQGGRLYDFFRDRLMFPIRDEQGKVVAFGGRTLCGDERKYMNSREVPEFYEKRRLLYGLDQARKARPKRLVVVEGYFDVVVPHQHGRCEFVASLGTAFTVEQARLARRYVDEVVLLFDGDEAGANATLRALAHLVGEEGLAVKVARLPGGLDPDEAVRSDPTVLDRALDEADDLVGFIIEESLRGYERSSPAGQERAVRAAIKLLARIPDKIRLFRELHQVAARFGLPEAVLREEISRAEVQQRRSVARRPRAQGPLGSAPHAPATEGVSPAERYLLEALLAAPDGAARVLEQGGGAHYFTPGAAQRLAAAIFECAGSGPVDPAKVLGLLEDSAARALCSELIGRIDPEKDYAREVEGWTSLRRRLSKRRRAELLRRIRAANDDETRRRLLALHQQLREESA